MRKQSTHTNNTPANKHDDDDDDACHRTTTTTSCLTHQHSPVASECTARRSGESFAVARTVSLLLLLAFCYALVPCVTAFTTPMNPISTRSFQPTRPAVSILSPSSATTTQTHSPSSSALKVTWFGGTAETEVNNSADSCELVAVRIERTSSNSRRIFGEIVVPCQLQQVWSILTDYDRLATHVPNLVESRIVSVQTPNQQPGDGQYRCRLFQQGAQKIMGFEFGASVTMDMVERLERTPASLPGAAAADNSDEATTPVARSIQFKCYDSFFFSEFDGQWRAVEQVNPATGTVETLLSYVVDVRPKGPVPVAALEWRIREDVPTNLRAVKSAALLQKKRLAQKKNAASLPPQQGESLLAYNNVGATTKRTNGATTATTSRATRTAATGGAAAAAAAALTPRQRQEQLEAAQAARRALRRPSISPFARAATPPPRKQRQQQEATAAAASEQQQRAHRRMAKFKVDWDDNETLGAYLKRP